VTALDHDSWVITDYDGESLVSADKGNISPDKISNFVNGIATIDVILDTPGTITITVRDSADPNKYGTCTLLTVEEDEAVNVSIKKPKRGYPYLFDKEIIPLKNTIIIGGITIEVDARSEDGIDRVEFYIYEIPINIEVKEPYRWLWDEFVVDIHEIEVFAYDKNGGTATDKKEAWIFNL
jgi:hypothetical protein